MIKMLVRHGNSFALILDKPVLELLKVDPEKPLRVSTTDGRSLVVTPASTEDVRLARRIRSKARGGERK